MTNNRAKWPTSYSAGPSATRRTFQLSRPRRNPHRRLPIIQLTWLSKGIAELPPLFRAGRDRPGERSGSVGTGLRPGRPAPRPAGLPAGQSGGNPFPLTRPPELAPAGSRVLGRVGM